MEHHEINITVLGYTGVGKSTMVVRQVNNFFVEKYDCTIEDIFKIRFYTDRKLVLLCILDTANYEGYSPMRDIYMKTSDGYIIVYSITNRSSFEDVNIYYSHTSDIRSIDGNKNDIPIFIVGNKVDLEKKRAVTFDEGQKLANSLNSEFMECSAKDNINITELFQCITILILDSDQYLSRISVNNKRGGITVLYVNFCQYYLCHSLQ